MSLFAIVILAFVVAAMLYAIVAYNALVAARHAVCRAWSTIDVLLKQRNDELATLIATLRDRLAPADAALTRIDAARAQVETAHKCHDLHALGDAERTLSVALAELIATATANPELRSADSFRRLSSRIAALENAIADRRDFYNAVVDRNNARVARFPDLIVARLAGFTRFDRLDVEVAESRPSAARADHRDRPSSCSR